MNTREILKENYKDNNIKLTFTDEEMSKMEETLSLLISDMRSLFEISPLIEIEIPFMIRDEKWHLYINKEGIVIVYGRLHGVHYDTWILEKKEKIYNGAIRMKQQPLKDPKQIMDIINFMSQYESIRYDIEEQIRKYQEQKDFYNTKIDELRHKYDKEAIIELEMHNLQRGPRPSLIVKQEDNSTIGTVNMGYGTIKIITKGDIKLINQSDLIDKQKKIGG